MSVISIISLTIIRYRLIHFITTLIKIQTTRYKYTLLDSLYKLPIHVILHLYPSLITSDSYSAHIKQQT